MTMDGIVRSKKLNRLARNSRSRIRQALVAWRDGGYDMASSSLVIVMNSGAQQSAPGRPMSHIPHALSSGIDGRDAWLQVGCPGSSRQASSTSTLFQDCRPPPPRSKPRHHAMLPAAADDEANVLRPAEPSPDRASTGAHAVAGWVLPGRSLASSDNVAVPHSGSHATVDQHRLPRLQPIINLSWHTIAQAIGLPTQGAKSPAAWRAANTPH